ncbi:hypothetical protein Tco_0948719 [Tanacetum coccineum]
MHVFKYGAVKLLDQNKNEKIVRKRKTKKVAKIGNVTVAEILQADVGRYLDVLNHIKMETSCMLKYRLKGNKCDCGLDGNHAKLQKQPVVLRKKYICYTYTSVRMQPVEGKSEVAHGEFAWCSVRCSFDQSSGKDKVNGTMFFFWLSL